MAVCHVVGCSRAGRRCLFRTPFFDLIEPPWHGLSKQRGQYIRASIATPESSSTSPQHLSWCRSSVSAAAQTSPSHITAINLIYIHTLYVLIGVPLVPSLLHRPQVQRVMHTRRPFNSVAGASTSPLQPLPRHTCRKGRPIPPPCSHLLLRRISGSLLIMPASMYVPARLRRRPSLEAW